MDKAQVERRMAAFVADLRVGDEWVPLDRALAAHLDTFTALRGAGLTWRSIAALVGRAGGRRRDGGPISPDQLRADVARLVRRRKRDAPADEPRAVSRQARTDNRERRPAVTERPAPGVPATPTIPVEQGSGGPRSPDTKAVSTDDIAAALKRIRTT